MQAALTGAKLPKGMQALLRDALSVISDEPEEYLEEEIALTTQQVLELLRHGQPVDVDLSRFAGDPEKGLLELQVVRAMASQNPFAQAYAEDLEQALMAWVNQLAMMRQMMGQQGQQQGGQGQRIAGQAQRTPLPSFLPPNAMTEMGAQRMGVIPTTPIPVGMQ